VSPKFGGEFPESRIVEGYAELDTLGRLRPALVSRVGIVVIAVIDGAGKGVERLFGLEA